MKSILVAVLCLVLMIGVAGCGPKEKSDGDKPQKKNAMDEGAARMLGAARDIQPPKTLNTYTWTLPAGWTEKKAAGMRAASFDAKVGEVTADVSIVELVGTAGGLEANVNRWRKQVGLPALAADQVESAGKEDQMKFGPFRYYDMSNPDLPDRAFYAALGKHGSVSVFVKLTAKANELAAFEPTFLEFCRSLDMKMPEQGK